jgi:hypothetical protein
VLRRGRRRQAGIVAGGALGGIAVLLVAGGIAMSMLGEGTTDQVPAAPDAPYGERTAIIERFQVIAPAGWTLVDHWPMATLMAAESTSCSGTFSAVGEEIGGDGSPGPQEQAPSPVAQEVPCTTAPASLPAGIPVLQLSTFDPGLMSPVCDVYDQGAALLPDDGVATMVIVFPGAPSLADIRSALGDHCAATPDIGAIVSGAEQTFVTATFAGAEADPASIAIAKDAVQDLGGHDTEDPRPSPISGPAYVVATVEAAEGTVWQLEAGVHITTDRSGVALFVVEQGARYDGSAAPIAPPLGNTASLSFQSSGYLVAGTAGRTVSSISADGEDATLVDWPASLLVYEEDADLTGGHIWWLTGDATSTRPWATLTDGSTEPVQEGSRIPGTSPSDLSGTTVAEGRLPEGNEPWRVTAGDCPSGPCLQSWVGGAVGTAGWELDGGLPPEDEPSVFVDYADTWTLVVGTIPTDAATWVAEQTLPDGTTTTVDATCSPVAVSGFEGVCPFAAMLPAGDQVDVRFLDDRGDDAFPAFRDRLGGGAGA